MRFGLWAAPLLGLSLVVVWPQAAVAQSEQNSCITCHQVLPDERLSAPAEQFPDDIHATKGFICIACHGGDATIVGPAAMDPAKGYIGSPQREQVPALCGRCHSNAQFMRRFNPALRVDQVTEFEASVHGQKLLSDGDPNVATCTSCHTVHSIKPASDPRSSVHPLRVPATCGRCHADEQRMARYNIPTDQLDLYQTSIHWETISEGGDLSAPTCNDCHGNHGAAPPGLAWVGNVCAQCHSMMAEFFNESRHSRVFALLGNPGCATCHRNHDIHPASDEMLGLGEGAVCVRCHTADDQGGQTAGAFRMAIDSLRTTTEETHSILLRAENSGMEVSQALFALNGAQDALVKARATIHSFDIEQVNAEVGLGLEIVTDVRSRGEQALSDLRLRRVWLAVSVVIIVALIVGLAMKIQEIERRA